VRAILWVAAALAVALSGSPASSADDKVPVRVLVGLAAGGSNFTPIGRMVKFETALAIGPLVQAKTFADFVAWAKANPSLAAYGTPGAGTSPHFVGVMLSNALGLPLTHVPYKSL
jgi:tripartite-type tricarboxylate transporter receptor subunit TctC